MSKDFSQRRECRVAALQYLYGWSINRPDELAADLSLFFAQQEKPRDHYAFAEELIQGVVAHQEEIDRRIADYAQNWDFQRIAKIDLAILRLAIFEMLFRRDIPPVVSINEAIELTKAFSNADAKRFVNGILDRLRASLDRPARTVD